MDTPQFKSNAEFNRALCESRSPLPVREFVAFDPETVRKLTDAEAVEVRKRAAISEAVGGTIAGLYEAKVAHVDKINQNRRVYPREVMSANIDRLGPAMPGGALIGTAGHPGEEEYHGDPTQIATKWHELSILPDGAMMGLFSIVPTQDGKDVQVCLDAKLSALGFSTYGFGSAHAPSDAERTKYGLGPASETADYDEDENYIGPVVMDRNYEMTQLDCVRGPAVADAKVTRYPDARPNEAVVERNGSKVTLAEACSTGLHWKEVGRCGHVISQCKCEANDKHYVYADKTCDKCAANSVAAEGMTKAEFKKLIAESKVKRPAVSESREPLAKTYTQYVQKGNAFSPAGPIKLVPELSKDAFNIIPTWDGIRFERHITQTDQAYRFEGSPGETVLQEIDAFWKKKPEYKKFGIMHRRGVVVHGPPGTGKSVGINQAVEMVTAAGDVAFYAENIEALKEGLEAFREVEPDRKVLVILEDAEKFIGYQERPMLQLLDGSDSLEGVLYIASTNYLNRFPERLLRSRRFDRKVFVGPPNTAGRKAYLQHKIGTTVSVEEVDRIATETDGLSYGDLATLITDAFILGEGVDSVISRLKGIKSSSARLPDGQNAQRTEPVQENRANKITESAAMDPIKNLSELQTKAPEVHAMHVAALKVETDGRVAMETRVAALESEKTTLASEKVELTTKVAELQARLDAKERAAKVFAKAKPILADNAYAAVLKEEVLAKCASDPTFDDTKVEAFIDSRCVFFDRVSGGTSKGKKSEGTKPGKNPKGSTGREVSDEELDEMELEASESQASDPVEEDRTPIEPASELTSAFGRPRA